MEISEKKKLLKEYGFDCEPKGGDSRCRIGIIGMMMAPIRLAGKLFGIDAFSQGIAGRPYDISLSYGEKTAFYIRAADGEWEAVAEGIWHEYMSGLTDNGIDESRFETMAECPCEILKKADVLLKSLDEDWEGQQWNAAFFGIDRWCITLSATKLLCSLERIFSAEVAGYYHSIDYSFYLGEMELIASEEDRMYIGSSLDTFAGQFSDEVRITDQADEVCKYLFEGCWETEAALRRRDERRVMLQLFKLKGILRSESDEYLIQAEKQREIIDRVELLSESMGKIEGDFCRQIRIYHLRELQQKMHQKLEKFDGPLQHRIERRINEEDDLSELVERIMPFLTREWEKYLKDDFAGWSCMETDSINRVLWMELKERITELCKQDGIPDIASAIEKDLCEAAVQLTGSMPDIPDNITRHEKGLFDSEALPVVFIAVGAVAGIAGALLPGLAFAAIGIKSKMNQQAEKEQFRRELIGEALLQEKQILKHMKEGIDIQLQKMESEINQWTHMQFVRIGNALEMHCGQLAADRDRYLAKKAQTDAVLQNIG